MALIKCPECGGNVSSQAKQCPHCGCKFTVCPECGEIKIGERSVCDACGFSFATENNRGYMQNSDRSGVSDNAKSEYDTADIIELWKSRVPYEKAIIGLFKWVPRIMAAILAVCIVIIGVTVGQYSSADGFEKLKMFESTLSTLKGAAVGVGISWIISDCQFVKTNYIRLRCSTWLRTSNFDVMAYCKRNSITLERLQSMCEDTFADCSSSIYMRYNKKATTAAIVEVVIYALIIIIATIVFSVGLYESLETVIDTVTLEQPVGIEQFALAKLIVPIVMIFISDCASTFLGSRRTAKATAWLNAHLSDNAQSEL